MEASVSLANTYASFSAELKVSIVDNSLVQLRLKQESCTFVIMQHLRDPA